MRIEDRKKYLVCVGNQYVRFVGRDEHDLGKWRWTVSAWDAKRFDTEADAKRISKICAGKLKWFDTITGVYGDV